MPKIYRYTQFLEEVPLLFPKITRRKVIEFEIGPYELMPGIVKTINGLCFAYNFLCVGTEIDG